MSSFNDPRKLVDVIRGLEFRNKRLESKIAELERNHKFQMEQKEEEYSERSHDIMEKTRQKFEQATVLKQERSLMQQQISAIADQLAVSENQAAVTREVATKYKQECQALQEHIDVMRREAIAAAEQQASLHEDHLLKLTHEHNVTVRELQEQHKQVIGTFEQAAQSKDGNDMRLQKALTAERKRMAEYQSSVREAFQEATEKNSAIILSMNEQHSSVVESLKSKHAQESADIQTKLSASYANEMQQAVIAHQLEVRELKAALRREGRTHMLKNEESRHFNAEALATRDSQHAEELRALNETLRRDHEQVLATKDAQHAEDLRGLADTLRQEHEEVLVEVTNQHELERTQLEEDCRGLEAECAEYQDQFDKERSGIQDTHMRTLSAYREEHANSFVAQESAAEEDRRLHVEALESLKEEHGTALAKQYKAHEGVLISLADEHARQMEELEITIERQSATIEALLKTAPDRSVVDDSTEEALTPSRLFSDDDKEYSSADQRKGLEGGPQTPKLTLAKLCFLLVNVLGAAFMIQKFLWAWE